MTDIDAFAGPGGWSVAKAKLGRKGVGIELDPVACATARAAGHERLMLDVSKLDPRGALTEGPVELMTQSPPCTAFSASGLGAGRVAIPLILKAVGMVREGADADQICRQLAEQVGDKTAHLVLEPLRWTVRALPTTIALEQVPPVLPLWRALAEALKDLGYSAWSGVLRAEQYGVPQTRRRAVLLASRAIEVKPPPPTHSQFYPRTPERLDPGVLPWISMAQALGFGLSGRPAPTITGGGVATGGAEPIAKFVERWANRPDWVHKRPATTVQGDPRLAAPGHRCMTADCHPDREPESMMAKAVRITVEEAAILQGFPSGYPWQGNKGQQHQQVGNAVPPPLAWHVLRAALGLPVAHYPAN